MTREEFEKIKRTEVAVPCMYQYLGARSRQKCFPSQAVKDTVIITSFVGDEVIVDRRFISYKSVDLV